MNRYVLYAGSLVLTWHGVIMMCAIAAAVLLSFLFSYEKKACGRTAVLLTSLIGIPVSLACSRLVYWYCCYEQYNGIADAYARIGASGQSLLGAMIGTVISAAVAAAVMRGRISFFEIMDIIVPGGAFGICVGRLAAFYSQSDRGNIIISDPRFHRLPFSCEVVNSAGVSVWRFPTFLAEAAATLLIAIICAAAFVRYSKRKPGTVFLLFLSLFGATQAVLESTRYDALYMRSNGFVSLMQIVCAVMTVTAVVWFGIRAVSSTGMKKEYGIMFGLTPILIAAAGFCEYYVQRHADMYPVCYSVMFAALITTSVFCIRLAVCCDKGAEAQ